MKKIIISLTVLVVLVMSLFFIFKEKEDVKTYKKVKVSLRDFEKTVSTSGEVKPMNRLEVKSSVQGRVEKIFFEEGDLVKKGETLGLISSLERVALIDAARAKGETELSKWENLYKPTPLISAIDGTLILKSVEEGQTIGTGDPLLTIADKLIIVAEVDETDVAKVQKGQRAKITLDAYPETNIEGEVYQIAYEAKASDNVTVYEVKIMLLNPPSFMKSGMSVDISFITSFSKDVLSLPLSAIEYEGQDSYVLMGEPPKLVKIKTGIEADGYIEIKEGLSLHDEVLSSKIEFNSKKTGGSNPFMPTRKRKK